MTLIKSEQRLFIDHCVGGQDGWSIRSQKRIFQAQNADFIHNV